MLTRVELPDLQLCKSAPDKIDASLNESTTQQTKEKLWKQLKHLKN
jgi:hypothetical protein